MAASFSPLKWLLAFAARLRFPQLFLLTGAIFVLDLFIPDMIPFVDEVLLGLVTALIGSWKRKDNDIPPGDDPPANGKRGA
jgi:hypothetical protein